MKRKDKSQEQSEAQAKQEAHDLKIKEAKRKYDAYQTARKNEDTGWPPFPLPDIFDNDDPNLIYAAIDAIARIRRCYCKSGFNSPQYKAAFEVASDARIAWSNENLTLPEIPIAKNIDWPTEQDFFELQQWFSSTSVLVRAEIATNTATMHPASGGKARDIIQSIDRLNDCERNICEGLGSSVLVGEKIAQKAGYPYNSNFKSTLARLRKLGILENNSPGYTVKSEYRHFFNKTD
jgi:hypothetical protein